MQIEPEVGAEALHHHDGAATRGAQPGLGGEPAVARLDRVHRDARQRTRQLVIERRPNAQVER
jgi:hypothetical protein